MTATQETRAAVERAEDSTTLEVLARIGFVGYGVVHALVAWIAVQLAWGRASAEGNQQGAFRVLAGQPFGRILLSVIAVGLVAIAAWQVLQAAVGHRRDTGRERIVERVASAGRAAGYAVLAVSAFRVAVRHGGGSGDAQQRATSSALDHAGGRWLVALAGVAVIGFAVGLAGYGIVHRFEKHLMTARMTGRTRSVVRWLGVVGYSAKGVAYAIVGVLLVAAAVTYDPAKSRGLDAALHALADRPMGRGLLLTVAVGIAAFGGYAMAQARYREV